METNPITLIYGFIREDHEQLLKISNVATISGVGKLGENNYIETFNLFSLFLTGEKYEDR